MTHIPQNVFVDVLQGTTETVMIKKRELPGLLELI